MTFRERLCAFGTDERGVMTFWLLTWSIVFIAFAGLAVDVANAYRTRAMLQATADAAAHAGAIELVQAGSATVSTSSTTYAEKNMSSYDHGTVLASAEVTLGYWDPEARTFDTSGTNPSNAVRTVARRASENDNSLPTSLLRIVDLESWNVSATSIASAQGYQCSDQANRIVALGMLDMTSNWEIGGDLCLHGEVGIDGNDNNFLQMPNDVIFSMRNTAYSESQPSYEAGWAMNSCGNCTDRQKVPSSAENFVYEDVGIAGQISAFAASFEAEGGYTSLLGHANGQKDVSAAFAAAYAAGEDRFYITCAKADNAFSLSGLVPDNILKNVTIYSGPLPNSNSSGLPCTFRNSGQSGGTLKLEGVTIVTTSTNKTAIELNGQPVSGDSACQAYSEGLRLWTLGGVSVTAEAKFPSLQILAKDDVSFSAKLAAAGSLEIVTESNVTLTSAASGADKGILAPTCGYVGGSSSPYWDSVHIVN